MNISMYNASVPVFKQMLGALDGVLAKAEAYTAEKKLDPSVLVHSRLFPDMFPLSRQVQIACDFAKGVPARLAGVEMPVHEDNEQTLAELRARIASTIAFIDGIDPAKIAGSEDREITLRPGTPRERTFKGLAYLTTYGLPNFFFHVTTAYALLRHNGVVVGKPDYLGAF
jgi:hypothetical protein